jgi:hypothetical protein
MAECIDIFRSIGASCNALNNVGGVNKRVWITQLSQVLNYTFDSDGYLNTIELTSGNTLKTITGKKFSNSGTFEGVIGNAKLIKQNAILKIFYSNPTDKSSIETYIKAQQLVVFFETESKKIEVYGLEKGMTLSAFVGGTGTNLQDESSALYTISGEQKSLPFYFRNGTFIESVEYLNNLAIPSDISSYTAGVSQIDFDNNGGDDWSVGFKIAPTSLQVPSGVTVDSIDYGVAFWSGGTDSALDNGNSITDYTFSTNSNGAGVYDLDCTYNMSDGSSFTITKLVAVDGGGTILASVEAGGVIVNSVNGLVIDISADITQVGVNYPIMWGANPIGLLPEIGADVVLTIPIATTDIVTLLTLDSTFTNDYSAGGALVFSSINIS